ncbi:DNA polymerase III subunit delta [Acetobacter sp. AN02]|uniref:DNA polymerase III subunit delta n=1 Tax=Acetobacter sp. AN02 TaxID=2894186 RepID=UPI00243419C4|nr:DNA polymerase III subunit delta [Acetobacter sp. AN02]MDG6094015.1 DNA polymerase III subunit delta [Acetobacter sp. AN02]
MKTDARQLRREIRSGVPWRFVLLHGEDTGLIRELAAEIVQAVAGGQDDPFRVSVLTKEDHERLAEEAAALSLTGGRRVVRVREGTDGLAGPLAAVLDEPGDTVIVVEGGNLPARAKLRVLAEGRRDAASVGCYPEEGRALGTTVSAMFAEEKVRIDPDALDWLVSRLGADRAVVRSEVGKLILFAGLGGSLSLEDVREAVGDGAAVSVEDAAFHAMEGQTAAADIALERALSEGVSPVAVARVLLSHIGRLRRVAAAMQDGRSRADAMKTLRPPVFFKRTQSFGRALDLWSLNGLEEAARRTQEFELSCKQSGAPDILLCRRHLTTLALRAARAGRVRSG